MPGHLAAFEMAPGRMRRFGRGMTMSFRPHQGTNLWRSDPAAPLDAWLELS